MSVIYVKDSFVPASKATVSVEERGFRFGDGIFETIRVHDSVPYQWELHFRRMRDGLKALKIKADLVKLKLLSDEIIKKNKVQDGILRISISRGIGSLGYLPTATKPTVVIETLDLPKPSIKSADLWLSSYEKISPHALPVNAKLMQGVNSTLARLEAQENECFESLQLNSDKYVCECSSGNIFWFVGDILHTPELSCGLVDGTTRDAVLRLSPFRVKQGKYQLEDLSHADEVFICNVAWGILPVTHLKPVGYSWKAGKKTQEIKKLIKKDMDDYAAA